MRRVLAVLVALILVPGVAAAQSPSPEASLPGYPAQTRNICLTISGPLIDTVQQLTRRIRDGSITIDAFVEEDCNQGPAESLAPSSADPKAVVSVATGLSFDDGDVHWAVVLRNPNRSGWVAEDMPVQVSILDAHGGLLDSAEDTITLAPGQTSALVGSSSDAGRGAKRLEVQISNDPSDWTSIDYEPGGMAASQLRVTRETYSNSVTGRLASDFEDRMADVKVVIVYRSAGKVIGGDETYLDFVPGGGTAAFKVYSDFAHLPKGVKPEAYYQISVDW